MSRTNSPILHGTPFVGRAEVVAEILHLVRSAGPYRGRVMLLAGERGVGKTRLAAEIAQLAEHHGVGVAWGRAWEGAVAPPYWPWRQALRAIAARHPRLMRRHRRMQDRFEAIDGAGDGRPGDVPLGIYEEFVSALAEVAMRAPLLLVLDDLQSVDHGSLTLLQFVSRDMGAGRFTILATYREDDVARRPALAEALGALDQRTRHIALAPLMRTDVHTYLCEILGSDAPDELVEHVWCRSGGNAFFLDKLTSRTMLQVEGPFAGPQPIPPGVREEVIGYRLAGLSEDCRQLLDAAAVFEREFSLDILTAILDSHAAGQPAGSRLLAALNEALVARVLRSTDGGAHYVLTPPLVRDVLYEHLPYAERCRLHRAAAESLRVRHAGRVEIEMEIAAHLERCGSAEALVESAAYAASAAARFAAEHQEAAAVQAYRRALSILDRLQGANDDARTRRRCGWLLEMAEAMHRCGQNDDARGVAHRAAALARGLPEDGTSAEIIFRAVLVLDAARPWTRTGIGHDPEIALLQEALRPLPPGDGALRARVLASIAARFWQADFDSGEWRDGVSCATVAMARRVGDPQALAHALRCRHTAGWFATTVRERVAITGELLALARSLGDRELLTEAHFLRGLDCMEAGDLDGTRCELHLCREQARETGNLLRAWHVDVVLAARAAFEGRLAEAERLAGEALAVGQQVQPEDAGVFFGVHMYTLHRLRGQFAALLPQARAFAEQLPTLPIWRVGVADVCAQLGRTEEAREEFERFAAVDFAEPPRDWNWLLAMALLSEVCAFLGDHVRAARLYARLLPCADQNVTAVPGLACIGSTAYHLGLLSATMQRWDDAAGHFEHAVRRNVEMGGLPYAAHAQRQLAAMRIRQLEAGQPIDRPAVERLIHSAGTVYARLGMEYFAEQASALQPRLSAAAPPLVPAGRVAPARHAMRFARRRCTIVWRGEQVELRALTGLRQLAHLIQRAPQPVHATELLAACGDAHVDVLRAGQARADGLSLRRVPIASVFSDPEARAQYAERVADLDAEIAEAESHHDVGRLPALRAQRERLLKELSRAHRRLAADDKLRKRVWRTLQSIALPAIRSALPSLADHLDVALSTGTFCQYAPDPPERWEIEIA